MTEFKIVCVFIGLSRCLFHDIRMLDLVWCLRNNYTFVVLKLAWGEARGRECIPSDTRPTEQRSPRPISAQPEGRHVFWAEALLLAPYRSAVGYARRSRLDSAQNPLPRMYSYFGDTTLVSHPKMNARRGAGNSKKVR